MKLIKLDKKHENQHRIVEKNLLEIDKMICPGSFVVGDLTYSDYLKKLDKLEKGVELKEGVVRASLFVLMKGEDMVGAIDIRHELNSNLKQSGGHIGYGINPKHRNKGCGKLILHLALKLINNGYVKIKEDKVLITCKETNIGSEKIILGQGGVYDSNVLVNNVVYKRFWIRLNKTSK